MTREEREELGRKYPVEVVDYDPRWPALYEAESGRLLSRFPRSIVLRTEHFGSTAVPGLASKPVVDILVEISSFEDAEREVSPVLEAEGCHRIWRSDLDPPHLMFVRGYGEEGYVEGAQLYHLHMAPNGHPFWERLLFCGHLREHPEDAKRYAGLKRRLAAEHRNDREAYTEAKTAFVEGIMRKARAARGAKNDRN